MCYESAYVIYEWYLVYSPTRRWFLLASPLLNRLIAYQMWLFPVSLEHQLLGLWSCKINDSFRVSYVDIWENFVNNLVIHKNLVFEKTTPKRDEIFFKVEIFFLYKIFLKFNNHTLNCLIYDKSIQYIWQYRSWKKMMFRKKNQPV